jgi:ubiquinone biosynthesis protein UbiJ
MLANAAFSFVNHLLDGEDWACSRLKPFAGQTVRLELGALNFLLEITAEGRFRAGNRDGETTVIIALPVQAPILVLTDRPSLLAAARINGSAELAEALGFVFSNLHWDVESDLSLVLGDIAARRLVEGGQQAARWTRDQAMNLALNLAEYLTEENQTLARPRDVATFCHEVATLNDEVSALEARLIVLEG